MLGLSQDKGSNVRFCRSMEVFVGEGKRGKYGQHVERNMRDVDGGCVFGD